MGCMTYEAERQVKKALRSLPWYLFLLPAVFAMLIYVLDEPGARGWEVFWSNALFFVKLGLCFWILRQLLRALMFRMFRNTREAIEEFQLTRR